MLLIIVIEDVFNLHFTSKSVVFEWFSPAVIKLVVHLYCPACDKVISLNVVSVIATTNIVSSPGNGSGELLDSVKAAESMLSPFKLHDILNVSLHSSVQDTVTSQVIVYSVVLPITGTVEGVWVTTTISISIIMI